MKANILREKSFRFAVRIVNLCKCLCETKEEFVLSKQILKSGTSIGALIRESEYSESKPDFIHKLSIAQKEANETIFWLELLHSTEDISTQEFESLNGDAIEIIKLITSNIKTAKPKISNQLAFTAD